MFSKSNKIKIQGDLGLQPYCCKTKIDTLLLSEIQVSANLTPNSFETLNLSIISECLSPLDQSLQFPPEKGVSEETWPGLGKSPVLQGSQFCLFLE